MILNFMLQNLRNNISLQFRDEAQGWQVVS